MAAEGDVLAVVGLQHIVFAVLFHTCFVDRCEVRPCDVPIKNDSE